jgi:hypothetical protein
MIIQLKILISIPINHISSRCSKIIAVVIVHKKSVNIMNAIHIIDEFLIIIYDLKSSSFQKENNIQVQIVAKSKKKSLVTKYHIEYCKSRK